MHIHANILGASKPSGIVRNGLQLHLPFTRDARDLSGNGNHTNLYTGKCLSFDGDGDYIQFNSISLSGEFTIAVWIKLDSYTNSIVVGDGDNEGWFRIENSNTTTIKLGTDFDQWDSGAIFNVNTWHRIAFIRKADNTVNIAVDGIIYTSNAPINISTFNIDYIGRKTGVYVDGSISDVQIWDKAFTDADIAFDYNNKQHLVASNSASSITLANLKGYWHISEGDGSIAYDSSGHGNNGTITGASWLTAQPTIPQLGLMDSVKSTPVLSEVTLIADPNDPVNDILDNTVRLREHSLSGDSEGYALTPSISLGEDFTIEAWVKSSESGNKYWLGSESDDANRWYFRQNTSDQLQFYAKATGETSLNAVKGSSFTAGAWTYIAVVSNSVTGKTTLYVNESYAEISGTINLSWTSPVYINRFSWLDTEVDGLCDEPKIYNRALTDTEISRNYKAQLNQHR